ncbi:hypothetical protein SXIM_44880 [Streptomyces xiamenensis]|uniref:Uncharacterized protein n=1 Tax=Streptomyces xiamenensis TaxID=408015 RepID=A0A0F7FZZ7_9ACTN|nr:hypothetical protein SXIM_44880 [Streptomyces xiamenensis]
MNIRRASGFLGVTEKRIIDQSRSADQGAVSHHQLIAAALRASAVPFAAGAMRRTVQLGTDSLFFERLLMESLKLFPRRHD